MKKHFNELFEFDENLKMYKNMTPLTVRIDGRQMEIINIKFPPTATFPPTDIPVALVKDKNLIVEYENNEIIVIGIEGII